MSGILDFPDGSTWVVPDGWTFLNDRPSACRSCGARVLWLVSKNEKRSSPFNPDGIAHWATCPDAATWRAPRRPSGTRSERA